jgi:hypothetical protein
MKRFENCATVPGGTYIGIPKATCNGILIALTVPVSTWMAPIPAVTLVLFSPD